MFLSEGYTSQAFQILLDKLLKERLKNVIKSKERVLFLCLKTNPLGIT